MPLLAAPTTTGPPPTAPPPPPAAGANGSNGSNGARPVNDNEHELGGAARVEPIIDAEPEEFTDDAPPDINAGPTVDPQAEADAWQAHMRQRIEALGAFGEMVAEGLVGIVEANRARCEELGMYWPKLSSRPEDEQTWEVARAYYKECCLYTLALLPVRPGKYTPAVICVGGQVASFGALAVAQKRAAGQVQENREQPRQDRRGAELELEPEAAPKPTARARRGWADENLGGAGEAA